MVLSMKNKKIKKEVIKRSLLGAPIGVAISFVITVFISLAIGDGKFYPVVPELINDCGSEMNAVLLQTVLSLLYGAAFGGASVVWNIENWSILKQTLVHLIVCSVATFPIAFFCRWMNHTLGGILSYILIFFAVYLGIWLSLYFLYKKRIKELNEKIKNTSN